MRSLTEIQSFKNSKLALITIVGLGLLPLILFTVGWAQMKSYDNSSLIGMAITIFVTIFTMLVLLRMKTFIQLEPHQLVYQSQPFFKKTKAIATEDIEHWEITKHRWMDGLGYRSTMQGTRVYVMTPGNALLIKTKDGRTYKFGINRNSMVLRFIKTHWEQKEVSYG